jgi:hypothetical protein
MQIKTLLLFVATGIMLYACSNTGTKSKPVEQSIQKEIVITNDLENAKGMVPSWLNENHVINMAEPLAHSGDNACITNDTAEYSYTYCEILKNLSSEVPKMAKFSGWAYTTVDHPNFAIICSFDENGKHYNWKAFSLDKELAATGKWIEFSATFYFDDKPLKPEHEIRLYAWNQSKKTVYIDDLKVIFSY